MRISLPAVLAFLCGFAATVVVVQHRVPALGALHLDGTHSPHHLRAKPADFAPAAAAAPRSGLLDKLRAELPAAWRARPPAAPRVIYLAGRSAAPSPRRARNPPASRAGGAGYASRLGAALRARARGAARPRLWRQSRTKRLIRLAARCAFFFVAVQYSSRTANALSAEGFASHLDFGVGVLRRANAARSASCRQRGLCTSCTTSTTQLCTRLTAETKTKISRS